MTEDEMAGWYHRLDGHGFGFQGKPFNITVIQVYAPTSNAEEAEVEQFYEVDALEDTAPRGHLRVQAQGAVGAGRGGIQGRWRGRGQS